MPSHRQNTLGFVKKFGKFHHIKGRGLISPSNSIDDRFRKMTLMGTGAPPHHKIEGGTIKHHNRPYDLKDSAEIPTRPVRVFAPIHFKL